MAEIATRAADVRASSSQFASNFTLRGHLPACYRWLRDSGLSGYASCDVVSVLLFETAHEPGPHSTSDVRLL